MTKKTNNTAETQALTPVVSDESVGVAQVPAGATEPNDVVPELVSQWVPGDPLPSTMLTALDFMTMAMQQFAVVVRDGSLARSYIAKVPGGLPVPVQRKDLETEFDPIQVKFKAPERDAKGKVVKDDNGQIKMVDEVVDGITYFRKKRPYTALKEVMDMNAPPNENLANKTFNMYQGFGVQPNFVVASNSDKEKLIRILKHARDVICAGREEKYRELMRLLAFFVQNPDKKSSVAIIVQSKAEGSGKSVIGECLGRIFGAHSLSITKGKDFTGDFTGHLDNKLFIFVDEAFFAGNPQEADILKNTMSANFININAKFQAMRSTVNRLKIYMTTNHEWSIRAGFDARRWFVLKAADDKVTDRNYFDKLHAAMENGGDALFLGHLLQIDLKGWVPREAMATEELMDQIKHSVDFEYKWIAECISAGGLVGLKGALLDGADAKNPTHTFGKFHSTEVLYTAYSDWMTSRNKMPTPRNDFGGVLTHVFGEDSAKRRTVPGGNPKGNMGYLLPPLEEAEKAYERALMRRYERKKPAKQMAEQAASSESKASSGGNVTPLRSRL